MTVLAMHHWEDRERAFNEIRRVTRERFVAVSWDPDSNPFWLTRDYFPEIYDIDRDIFPCLTEFQRSFDQVSISILKVPADCADGFLGAYWRRPDAYLGELVRANMSTFSKISKLNDGLAQLHSDLESGAWESRNQDILDSEFLDVGYRIVIAELAGGGNA
jgi:SAM-dependent methyltransferase